MFRRIHAAFALAASVLVCFMAVTGAVLAVNPAVETAAAASGQASLTVADVATVATTLGEVERIVRTASGNVIAYVTAADGSAAAYTIDPATGTVLGAYDTGGFFSFFTELHRSLFLGDGGRTVAGLAAAALAILALSGMVMLVRRLGGWRHFLGLARGTSPQRLHVNLARSAVAGLVLSAITGVYMSLVTLGFVGDGSAAFLPFPDGVDGGPPAAIAALAGLQETPLTVLRELVFPYPGDTGDVFTLTTSAGTGFVDQATGALLDFIPNGFGQRLYEAIYLLHTGAGAWWLGLLLGLAALTVPVMAVSGIAIWLRRRRGQMRLRDNARPGSADAVILVGTEGNTTWGFAGALHAALVASGRKVHMATMNGLARAYPRAEHVFVLTATHGDGAAPSSARHFLARLARWKGGRPGFTVLGFGDRSFPKFCAYATEIETALAAKGWVPFEPMATIDRQSSHAFERWGTAIGEAIGTPLTLVHTAEQPRTTGLVLVERTDYGTDVQAPTVVLRFAAPATAGKRSALRALGRLGRFEPGDLVGIVAPGTSVPRYYSLASAARDGIVEICVRKQPGGLCSEFLHALEPGDRIAAFVKRNPDFRPARGKTPVVLIGAGTGIAPLIGFIGGNRRERPMYLYWGGRDPGSDFLYGPALARLQRERRLTALVTAFSRVVTGRAYVQDRIREDAATLRALVRRGAQIMVCGGKDMAAGVKAAIEEVVAPLGTSVSALKAGGRYLEDVY
ncbi:MAG: PepSY domain-containing protein [Bauldia sp.]|nr:PepSY domain-containing protein [Bauldia sp.]